ncbi:DDHD domain-containing protein [Entophlyctis helioformis]|nr:DDHD domain-containing protein [Entophlyctis helioformis]
MADSVPDVAPRWFRSTDFPKRDATPYKFIPQNQPAPTHKPPTQWVPFSKRDSAAIETVHTKIPRVSQTTGLASVKVGTSPSRGPDLLLDRGSSNPDFRIIGGEDNLYEIDVENKEVYPLYWDGPTYDIRRGTWFAQTGSGGTFQPCDENLSRQIEDGYRKFTPWQSVRLSTTQPSIPTSLSSAAEQESTAPAVRPEARWALFGPYMNQYVVYAGPATAWLQSDMLSSKFTRTLMNSSGVKLVRGWDEVVKLDSRARTTARQQRQESTPTAPTSDADKPPARDQSPTKTGSRSASVAPSTGDPATAAAAANPAMQDEDVDPDRQIDHLILVIHGIGQKLSERVDAVNFPQDCNVLRKTIKDAAEHIHERALPSKGQESVTVPKRGGVQVLPIQWRQKVQFGIHSRGEPTNDDDEEDVVLDDILPEGIPGIRMLVSDVILDVLLYLTPRYRQEMIKHVTLELNRVYALYKERNPNFQGQVSIYGHSLGSILAYDILSHQHIAKSLQPDQPPTPRAPEVDITDILAASLQNGRVSGLMETVDNLSYLPLDFHVNALFAVGSPVALFLLLRGMKIRSIANEAAADNPRYSRPDVKSLYNIFHPFDPVAHRFEPLVLRSLAQLKPMQVPYTKGGLTKTITGIQDIGSDIVERGRSIFQTVRWGLFTGLTSTAEMVNQAGRVIGLAGQAAAPGPTASTPQDSQKQASPPLAQLSLAQSLSTPTRMPSLHDVNKTTSSVVSDDLASSPSQTAMGSNKSLEHRTSATDIKASTGDDVSLQDRIAKATRAAEQNVDLLGLNPNGRVDFAIQESVLENPYLSSLGVHMSYWADSDCAMFVLKELYGIPNFPASRGHRRNPSTAEVPVTPVA